MLTDQDGDDPMSVSKNDEYVALKDFIEAVALPWNMIN